MNERELCALCVMQVDMPTAHVVVEQYAIEGQWDTWLDGSPVSVLMTPPNNGARTYLGHVLAGYGGRFADAVRALDHARTRWCINQVHCRVWAEANVFGLQVCYTHVRPALEYAARKVDMSGMPYRGGY